VQALLMRALFGYPLTKWQRQGAAGVPVTLRI